MKLRNMKILITGSNGQLGSELMIQGNGLGHEMTGVDIPEFDISDQEQINGIFSGKKFDVVINAAAYTAVDLAESEKEKAEAVNTTGPALLARACSDLRIPLIHVSTDYVFDGTKAGPYTESDPPAPLGVYGITKLNGETAVRNVLKEHIIVRTAWVYGVYGKNFVKTMLNLGRDRDELRVVSDQRGCPTDSFDLASALLIAAEKTKKENIAEIWGTYNFCGKGETTWHGFAEAIFEEASVYEKFKVKKIHAITTSEYPTPAKRPANSALCCTKFSTVFGVDIPEWRQSLNKMLKRLYV